MKVANIFIAALLASGSTQAASLEEVQGDVWVGHEKGFTAVRGPEDLSPGDKVKVGSKSFARIVYQDGCKVNLHGNSLSTVAKHSPCSFSAQAGGDDQGTSFDKGQNVWGPLVVVGGGIGAVVGAVVASNSNNGGSNNSPLSLLLLAQQPASP